MKKYLVALRIPGWAPFITTFLFGVMDSSIFIFDKTLIALLSICMLVGAAYYLNFISDREIDRINPRKKDLKMNKQPFASSEISVKFGYLISLILIIFSLILGYFVSNNFLILLLISIPFAIFYSLLVRFKELPPFDIIINAFFAGSLAYIFGLLANNEKIYVLNSFFFFFNIVPLYNKTLIKDAKYDKRIGVKTSAVRFGIKKLLKISFLFRLLSFVFLILILYFNGFLWYLPFFLLLVSLYHDYKLTIGKKVKMSEERTYLKGILILITSIIIRVMISV